MKIVRKKFTVIKWYKNAASIAPIITGFSLILVALIGGFFKNCGTPGSKETPEIHQTIKGNHGTQINKNDGVLNINNQTVGTPPDTVIVKK